MKLTVENLQRENACLHGIEWFMEYEGDDPWNDCLVPEWIIWAIGRGFDGWTVEILAKCAVGYSETDMRLTARFVR